MASICAITDKTIKDALQFPSTREIADCCFNEILTVARAKGYGIDEADFSLGWDVGSKTTYANQY
jgi:2-dehydropantoate 2-reductase